jgi:hypothetical protein
MDSKKQTYSALNEENKSYKFFSYKRDQSTMPDLEEKGITKSVYIRISEGNIVGMKKRNMDTSDEEFHEDYLNMMCYARGKKHAPIRKDPNREKRKYGKCPIVVPGGEDMDPLTRRKMYLRLYKKYYREQLVNKWDGLTTPLEQSSPVEQSSPTLTTN